jgi:acyl-CoA synthetase (AMP-forming)/AMP-acid ligase II
MRSILERIDRYLLAGDSSTKFTLYADEVTERRTISLEEIHQDALRIAATLPPSTAILIIQPDPLEFVTSFFGCLYAGAIAVPLPMPTRRNGLDQLRARMTAVDAKHCLTNRNVLERLKGWYGHNLLGDDLNWLDAGSAADATPLAGPVFPDPLDTAVIQFTSGSTGTPKAIAVSHENIVVNSRHIQECFGNTTCSASVCWLPNYHDMGLIDGIIQPVYSGFSSVLMSPISFLQRPVRWLRAISESRATYSGGPNFAFDHCVERIADEELAGIDLSSLELLYNGSERVVRATLQRFTDRFSELGFSTNKFVPCYGLAEATLAVTASRTAGGPVTIRADRVDLDNGRFRKDDNGVEFVGCGRPLGDTDLRILDLTTAREMEPGAIGEICVSGRSVTREYDSGSSEDRFVMIDGKSFLRTGDLGFVIDGELFVSGRIKDVIIIRGRNHDPHEIEGASVSSHPALAANGAVSFSISVDDIESLVVVQEVRRSFLRKIDFADVINSIVGRVSEMHGVAPYDVSLVLPGTLPKTTSGKIQRRKCRDIWTANGFDVIASFRGRAAAYQA